MAYGEVRPCVGARTRHTTPTIAKFLRTDLKRPKRMPESRIADLHIYLPEPDRSELIAWAQSEGRTASNLIKYIVR
jgi:CopG-like RHH_1 or ribbon-helix-helix domain, RHH_5